MNSVFANGPGEREMDLGLGPDPEPVAPDNQEQGTPAGQVVLSDAQFAQLMDQLGHRRQEYDYAAALVGTPEVPAQLPEIDLSQLPDPRVDFQGFQAGLAQVLSTGRDQIIDQAQQRMTAFQRETNLKNEAWELMKEKYPDLSNPDFANEIAASAQREWDSLASRGVDPISVLAQNMDEAVDVIAQRALSSINRIRGFQGDDPGDDGTSRTEMVGGRSPAPRAPTRDRQETPLSFVDELKKTQRELGIY